MYPLISEGLTLFLQEAAQIAAEDPALTRQIVEWSRQSGVPDLCTSWIVSLAQRAGE
jgi:hypothetical protein